MELEFAPRVIKQFNKFPKNLQDEYAEKLELFKNIDNHHQVKLDNLKGKMKGWCNFSVNYNHRVIVEFSKDHKVAYVLFIGDHSIYE